jgi:hypothetical protein
MGKMMIAMIALVGLSQAAWADDFSLNAPTLDTAHLPKKGVVSYEGTWATTGAWTGVSGPVQLVVDFGTGDVSADLTIPWLGTDSTASVARRFTPNGTIDANGGYLLAQGVSFSPDLPFAAMAGSFSNGQAKNTVGQFMSAFCVTVPCNRTIRTVTGTFAAARVQ